MSNVCRYAGKIRYSTLRSTASCEEEARKQRGHTHTNTQTHSRRQAGNEAWRMNANTLDE
jgi:hypothetical protein